MAGGRLTIVTLLEEDLPDCSIFGETRGKLSPSDKSLKVLYVSTILSSLPARPCPRTWENQEQPAEPLLGVGCSPGGPRPRGERELRHRADRVRHRRTRGPAAPASGWRETSSIKQGGATAWPLRPLVPSLSEGPRSRPRSVAGRVRELAPTSTPSSVEPVTAFGAQPMSPGPNVWDATSQGIGARAVPRVTYCRPCSPLPVLR